VHSFATFNRFYSDTGLFGVHFVANDNTLEQAVWLILQNLVRLCHNLTEEEVSRAKAQLLTTMLGKQDCVSHSAHAVARQAAHFGRRVSREETIARIQALTVKDVADWANLVINDEDHVLAAKGPIHELPDYNFIRRRTYWQRY
jgi:processing peptidase subunit beta